MKPLTSGALGLVAILLAVGIGVQLLSAGEEVETVTVVHWTNGHLLRDGSGLRLLRQMADEFNELKRTLPTGERIRVQIEYNGSAEQAQEVISRVSTGLPIKRELPNPTLITPSSVHQLVAINFETGQQVIDVDSAAANSIAVSYIGIVTYREMAECLGWPSEDVGFADIVALREDERGWSRYPCARAEWGQKPLLGFTDPSTSDTGRSVLLALYAIAAGKTPEDLALDDVTDAAVVQEVKDFQKLVDHYMIGTIPLNTKVYQGTRYGHFFLMPEDNLIHLYQGTEKAFINGIELDAPPIESSMVMIYPKEGSPIRANCACLVDANWVSEAQREASKQWVAYLQADEQQRSFMTAGFRPATDYAVSEPISGNFGLTPEGPASVFLAERIDGAVAKAIDDSWEEVKRSGIVSFVIDNSGSMHGEKLAQARDGLIRAIDNMASNNFVGLVTFAAKTRATVPVRRLSENRFDLATAAEEMEAGGGTALYDAIKAGIEQVDGAEPAAEDAIRAVVVLSDGIATQCDTALDELVQMTTFAEKTVREFVGCENSPPPTDESGVVVDITQVIGADLAIQTEHEVQIFFIGIGSETVIEVGRILAQASGAEYQGVAEKDLAKVLEEFSKYF